MKTSKLTDDPRQYATSEGIERFQFQQTAKMTLSERLEALDRMIRLTSSFSACGPAVQDESAEYKTSGK